MSDAKRLWQRLREWWRLVFGGRTAEQTGTGPITPLPPAPWNKATKASCWAGSNARHRHMNMLSPTMPDSKFEAYLQWQLGRGCNTVHWFLVNHGDGEHARVNPFGPDWGPVENPAWVAVIKDRIRVARQRGLAVVLWMMADDSGVWARKSEASFVKLYETSKALGLFDSVSYVVLGLELDEYWNAGRVARLAGELRRISGLKVGIHQTSGRTDYMKAGDIALYQMDPGASAAKVESETRRVRAVVNKPLVMFELARQEHRALCEAAFRGGAFAVGNW